MAKVWKKGREHSTSLFCSNFWGISIDIEVNRTVWAEHPLRKMCLTSMFVCVCVCVCVCLLLLWNMKRGLQMIYEIVSTNAHWHGWREYSTAALMSEVGKNKVWGYSIYLWNNKKNPFCVFISHWLNPTFFFFPPPARIPLMIPVVYSCNDQKIQLNRTCCLDLTCCKCYKLAREPTIFQSLLGSFIC